MASASSAPTDITYNVVGFPDTNAGSFGVLINGKITKLRTSSDTFPLWSATVPGTSASSGYLYVKLSDQDTVVQQEPFLRSFQNRRAKCTTNEFFLRQTTLPKLPQVFENVQPEPSEAFDDSQIATIHLTPNPRDFAAMEADLRNEKDAKAGFRFISADTVYSVEEVKVKVSGRDTSRFKKLSLRIKFKGGETFFERPIIKLRSGVFDPTMIREKLYIDILNAIGVRTTQAAWVRVYVNGQPYGFYLMVEDIEPPFLRETMHHGSSPTQLGSLYKMANSQTTGQEATMQFAGFNTADYQVQQTTQPTLEKEELYSNKNLGANPVDKPMTQLIEFFKQLHDYDPTLLGGVEFWNSRLDLDGFLRCMAMEYLGGNWDAYWYSGNNYFMYHNPTEYRWQFIPTDFDRTFSDGNSPDVLTSFKKFAGYKLATPGNDHPLVTKLIFMNKEINALFKQILLRIVNEVFNLEVLEPRINAFEKMIADEVNWDYLLDRSRIPRESADFTIDDFHKSIIGGVKRVNIGIKPWIKGRAEDVPASLAE
ncbi:hypothetical protein BGZ81_005350 [Podila clonocystis]|nr:hypothetical protein BGZ81_005350 [Podila clonocystis]